MSKHASSSLLLLLRPQPGEVAWAYDVPQGWVVSVSNRYRAEGEAAFDSHSARPRHSKRAIPEETARLIIELHKELAGQGLDAGPDTIAWHLQHHHSVRVSSATISHYLARGGWWLPSRASGRSLLTCGLRPSCRT